MKQRILFFGLPVFLLFLAGCVPTRHLKGNEKLLYDLELHGVEQASQENIEALYQQKPNRKIPFLGVTPYLSIYYLGKTFYNPGKIERQLQEKRENYARKIQKAGTDSAKVAKLMDRREHAVQRLTRKKEQGNWLMRSLGEPPSIYDSLLTVQTVEQINTYLNSKGFFHNNITFSTETEDKKVFLDIHIQENAPFKITSPATVIRDTAVARVVALNKQASLISEGRNYDEEILTQERDRLEMLLRNNGFFEFRKQYVTFDVDTSFGGNTAYLKTIISNPSDSSGHKMYRLRNIYFIEDAGLNRFGVSRDTVLHNKVHYLAYEQKVKPRVLEKKVRIAPGDKYTLLWTDRTQRQLTNLDVYRFASVNYQAVADSLRPLLDAYINVSAAPKFQQTTELGLNFSSSAAAEIKPLPFGSYRINVRNIFGSAENLEFGVRFGLEGQPSTTADKLVTTTEFGTNVALIFPQFLLPFKITPNIITYNPRTRINAAYQYTNREDYTRTNVQLNMDYFWNKTGQLQYIITPFNLNIVNTPRISETFEDLLIRYQSLGFPLIESFKTSIVSSMSATRLFNSNNLNQTLDAKYFKLYAEIGNVPRVLTGGRFSGGGDYISEFLTERTKNNYRSYSYVKINADLRRYVKLKEKMFVVGRINTGLATGIGGDIDNVLPYDKYFFAGGGSSLRAWRPRKLGPGSFSPRFAAKDGKIIEYDGYQQRDYSLEQPGELLLEGNLEYRFNIFSYLNGALFIDAGNVWTMEENDSRPGGRFSKDFYREIAVGTGFGFRFDFSFLILRFDIATKVFDPAEPEGERFVLNRFRLNGNTFRGTNAQNSFNLGIGYPF